MSSSQKPVLLLMLFKLNEGVTHKEWMDAALPVIDWAAKQPGYISADMYYDPEEDIWVDVEFWETQEQSAAHLEMVMQIEGNKPMFELMDNDSATVRFAHSPYMALGRVRAR